ncbi:MAG: winged helix-turn-helix domain-containing protein [Candidatus Bathyarchaeota archaeon]|nr:winged helix-turn-helix domain-containing protein [Candidatus Bathyarchaeota archaeon]
MERRTRYDIYQDVLETVRRKGATGITRISYGANLPVDRAKEVVQFLMKQKLVEMEEYGGNMKYTITGKGGQFLNALRTVKKFLDENNRDDEF